MRWRLKSPASRLFAQPFVQSQKTKKHQSFASMAFVRVIHRSPVNSPHKGPVTRKMFPFDDVIVAPIVSSLTVVSMKQQNRRMILNEAHDRCSETSTVISRKQFCYLKKTVLLSKKKGIVISRKQHRCLEKTVLKYIDCMSFTGLRIIVEMICRIRCRT